MFLCLFLKANINLFLQKLLSEGIIEIIGENRIYMLGEKANSLEKVDIVCTFLAVH